MLKVTDQKKESESTQRQCLTEWRNGLEIFRFGGLILRLKTKMVTFSMEFNDLASKC